MDNFIHSIIGRVQEALKTPEQKKQEKDYESYIGFLNHWLTNIESKHRLGNGYPKDWQARRQYLISKHIIKYSVGFRCSCNQCQEKKLHTLEVVITGRKIY